MKDLLVLRTLDEVRVLADPLRVRIVEELIGDPLTVRQVAERLGEKPTKLYHHFELLEKAGLIQNVRTQKKRATIETYYQATARSLTMDPNLFVGPGRTDEMTDMLLSYLTGQFQSTLAALRSSLSAGLIVPDDPDRTGTLAGFHIEATPDEIAIIREKIKELLRAANKTEGKGGPMTYDLTISFFPVQKRATKPPRLAKRRHR